MNVYKPTIVSNLEEFYGDLLFDYNNYSKIETHLSAIAKKMYEGCKTNHPAILREISNYHPQHLGKTNSALSQIEFTLEDCKHCIANEYGFANWEILAAQNLVYDIEFEKAINHLLAGDLSQLKKLIKQNPNLVKQKSKYGHEATLLHYTASNGVEFWRQKVPLNLPELTQYLLNVGVDKNATMKVYGGDFDAYALLTTSAHPLAAGIVEEMKKVLNSK